MRLEKYGKPSDCSHLAHTTGGSARCAAVRKKSDIRGQLHGHCWHFIRRCLQPRRLRAAMHQQTGPVADPYIKLASEAATRQLSGLGTSVAREKSHVLYGLECSRCPVEYVGETGKRLRSTKGPSAGTKLPRKCGNTPRRVDTPST